MVNPFFSEGLCGQVMDRIIERVCGIPIALINTGDYQLVELFHGPTYAFKDVGARFMAELLSAYQEFEDKELHILVATSGDTGSAVAAAFHGQQGIRVTILYPEGRVSRLQEQQLTTWGDNIQAIRINGSFDDCQRLVKLAFADHELRLIKRLSSANSINIARWLPQCIYYAEAYRQAANPAQKMVIAVPSGNLGNLTSGMVAAHLGLPVHQWIASTNENDVLPSYLRSGHYQPRPSLNTLANAMDVGDPSNFIRMSILGGSTWNKVKELVQGISISNDLILHTIREIYGRYSYILDPHTATAWAALNQKSIEGMPFSAWIMGTAHPSKFGEVIERALGFRVELSPDLKRVAGLTSVKLEMESDYTSFREYLMS